MKVGVVGTGRLGGLAAFLLAKKSFVEEIALVDVVPGLAEGQALDISHAVAHERSVLIKSGGYEILSGSDVVLVTAGMPRKPGQTRKDLAEVNGKIVSEIAKGIKENAGEPIVITLTNPMDAMNYLMWKFTGFDRKKVIGSGGQLDSARFKTILGKHFGVEATSVDAWVLGEHGEFQAPVFSRVSVNGVKKDFSLEEKNALRESLRGVAMQVISRKGGTDFAPMNCTVEMIEAIAGDSRKLMACSAVLQGEYGLKEVSLGVPVKLGKNGIEEVVEWSLEEYERNVFLKGVESTREAIQVVL